MVPPTGDGNGEGKGTRSWGTGKDVNDPPRKREVKMIQGLEPLCWEERLGELGLLGGEGCGET